MSEQLLDVFGPYLDRPCSVVVPIFGSVRNSLDLVGSGVLVKIGNETFVLTASHVTDHRKDFDLMIPGNSSLIGMGGYFADTKLPSTGRRLDDRYDTAYFRLDDEVARDIHPDFHALGPAEVDSRDVTKKGDAYTMIGYPATKSQIGHGTASAEIFTLTGEGTDADLYAKLQLSAEANLIVRYRRKKGVSFRTGHRTVSPMPSGMSGGGVFAWSKKLPDPAALAIPKLVAVLTEYHAQYEVFVATRLGYFLAYIANNNPRLPIYKTEIA